MAQLNADAFWEPLSPDQPCGPDLERAFDNDFTGLVVNAEGLLPLSFFEFKRDETALQQKLDSIIALTGRTRDLRLLALYAKFSILNRDLTAFSNTLALIADALERRWDDIHPQAEDGDFSLRSAALASLDDTPHVIMPLQHAVLLRHRALGDISYRSIQLARGVMAPRASEPVLDLSAVERALEAADAEQFAALRDLFRSIGLSVKRMAAACLDKPGMPLFSLPKLSSLATAIADLIGSHLPAAPSDDAALPAAEDAEDGEPGDGMRPDAPPKPQSGLQTRADAAAALRRIERYFQRCEPSSPALALVAFATRVMDRPFYEVLKMITPDYASDAELKIAGNTISMSVSRIAAALDEPAPMSYDVAERDDDSPPIETRRDALQQMSELSRYLRTTEPASPIPLLLGRAADLAGKDFSSLLRDLYTEAALRSLKGGDT